MGYAFRVIGALMMFAWGVKSHGYYQYAVQYGISRCTTCHFSPVGGGPRNINGKLFGAHTFHSNPYAVQEFASADLRLIYYRSDHAKESKGGAGVMSGSVAGHVALDEKKKIWMVLEHNVAGFSQAPLRDTYALFQIKQESWLESIVVGRFRAPFGLVTDEHRSYTRIQTATEWYTFETGILFSGNPSEDLHYDLAVVNGANNSGQNLSVDQADQWGGILNARWIIRPFLIGASGRHSEPSASKISKTAWSVFSGVTVGRWTWLLEHSRARGLNASLSRGFVSDPTYGSSIVSTESTAWLSWWEWAFNPRVALIYKFDSLVPDRNFPADVFERHGVGIRWALGPNVLLQARGEWARATHPSEKRGSGLGSQNAVFTLLQLAL